MVMGATDVMAAQTKHEITVSGTCFLLNGKPFPYTGISFYNAIYNPSFNKSSAARRKWLQKFQKYGINVLRIFSQWDQKNPWVDVCPECSLYQRDGTLREKNIARLKEILADAGALGMVVELEVFQHQSWSEGNLGATDEERAKSVERALPLLTRALLPYRNLTFQLLGRNDLSNRGVYEVDQGQRSQAAGHELAGRLRRAGHAAGERSARLSGAAYHAANRRASLGNRARRVRIPALALSQAGGGRRAGAQRNADVRRAAHFGDHLSLRPDPADLRGLESRRLYHLSSRHVPDRLRTRALITFPVSNEFEHRPVIGG